LSEHSIWKEINENYNCLKFDYALLEELFSKPKRPISVLVAAPSLKLQPTGSRRDDEFSRGQDLNGPFDLPEEDAQVVDGRPGELGALRSVQRAQFGQLECLKKILPEKSEVDDIKAFCRESPNGKILK